MNISWSNPLPRREAKQEGDLICARLRKLPSVQAHLGNRKQDTCLLGSMGLAGSRQD